MRVLTHARLPQSTSLIKHDYNTLVLSTARTHELGGIYLPKPLADGLHIVNISIIPQALFPGPNIIITIDVVGHLVNQEPHAGKSAEELWHIPLLVQLTADKLQRVGRDGCGHGSGKRRPGDADVLAVPARVDPDA